MEKLSDSHYLFDGKVSLLEIKQKAGIDLHDDEVTTIGGWLYSHLGEPAIGKSIEHEHITLTVREMNKNRIRKVEVHIGPKNAADSSQHQE
ncbi:Transporter associated domain protein [compost metagenome]